MKPRAKTVKAERAPAKPRRAKPVFEIPAETIRKPAAQDWVYRTDKSPPPRPPAPFSAMPARPNILFVTGVSIVAVSIGAVGAASLTAVSIAGVPFALASSLLRS